jgi:hypothetical protein
MLKELPDRYRDSLFQIYNESARHGFHLVLVGSLGIAATAGHGWSPTKLDKLGHLKGRDIDFFVKGSNSDRASVQQLCQNLSVRADIAMFNEFACFSSGGVKLTFRDISVPVDKHLFETRSLQICGVEVRLLDPLTHIGLILTSPILIPKMKDRIAELKSCAREDPLVLEPFIKFKRLIQSHYPIWWIQRALRLKLYELEESNHKGILAKGKNFLRQRRSIVEALRRTLDRT